MPRTVFFVSDSTGITAETLGHTLLTQFDNVEFRQVTLPFVSDEGQARVALERIEAAREFDGERPLVFSTLANAELFDVISRADALVLDVFSAFTRPLERELNRGSSHVTGRSHGLVDRASYEVRIEAVEFALRHDDGASVRHFGDADIVLVGVSRSGKTPTCLYLALQFGTRAANYPITDDEPSQRRLPEALEAYRDRLFGLTIDPERLRTIRSERRPNSRYASIGQCRKEVAEVEAMFRANGVRYLNTTTTSIEEIASRLLQETGLRRRLF